MAVSVLSGAGGSQVGVEPNDTLDLAQVLGDLSTPDPDRRDGDDRRRRRRCGRRGLVFLHASMAPPTSPLDLRPRGSDHPLDGVLSLYNSDPIDFGDLYHPYGDRLLAQDAGGDGDPGIERDLGPGTYDVAISGAGNLAFHPLISGSGFAGATGDYDLRLGAGACPSGMATGPPS